MKSRDAAFLRAQLAGVGIFIADPAAALSTSVVADAPPSPVDRALVRDILVCGGAPERDLEWLTASCPSVEAAQAYEPFQIAWCATCDAPVLCDNGGCIACRGAGDARSES
jgi:hypothetical protein